MQQQNIFFNWHDQYQLTCATPNTRHFLGCFSPEEPNYLIFLYKFCYKLSGS